jgi:DNA-directed RNA polymerase specialized sigma24 family protein
MTTEQYRMIQENLSHVYLIATRIIGSEDGEYLSVAHTVLVECALKPAGEIKGDFRGYVGRAVRFAVLRQRYRNARYEYREDAYWNSLTAAAPATDMMELINDMGSVAPVLRSYYLDGERPADIARAVSIPVHRVRSILRKSLPELKRKYLEAM